MSGLLAVLPVLDEHMGRECVGSMYSPQASSWGIEPNDLLVVDNTRDGMRMGAVGGTVPNPFWPNPVQYHRDPDGHNLGVARSWNLGAQRVLDHGLDYLVLVSAVMRFGPLLHTTFLWQMRTFWGADVIECDGHSWHLIALHRRCFERVGLFDENFYPAYEESIDWCYRLRLVGMEGGWPHVWVNALSAGAAWHAKLVACPNAPLAAYYEEKWGGPKGEEKWDRPFGVDTDGTALPLGYFPEHSIPDLAKRYDLGEKGVGWW